MSLRQILFVLSCVLACAAGCGAPSSPPAARPSPPHDDARARLDAMVEPWIRDRGTVGLSIVLVRGDDVDFASYGTVAEGGPAPDADTIYEIGSVTKVFTAVALARAVDDGLVTLDTSVASLLPSDLTVPRFDEQPITLAHLATHTSGLPEWPADFAPAIPADPCSDYDAAKLRASLASTTLTQRPGEGAPVYSTFGLGLLGHALARHAGTTYEALVIDRITTPLGMPDTRIELTAEQQTRLARGHDEESRPVAPWTWPADGIPGGGGLRSTPRDMATFVRANLRPEGELAAALRLAQEPRVPLANGGHVGLAWGISDTGAIEHEGETHGFHSWIGVDVEHDVAVVVLSNTAGGPLARLGRNALALLAGRPFEPIVLPPSIEIASDQLVELAGEYELAPGHPCQLVLEGDALRIVLPGQVPHRLFPSARDQFHLRVGDVRIHFERDADDEISALLILQGEHTSRAPRVR